jgi:DNA polymerase-3 subunit delta
VTDAAPEAVAPVYLVRGDDAALVAQAAKTLVDRLVGDTDPSLVVEEHGGPAADDVDVGLVVDACTTPPFLVDRRVVVLRDAGRLNAADAGRLVTMLEDPLATTVLVLVGGGGTVPQSLVKAVGARGEFVEASAGRGRERKGWVVEQLRAAPVKLDAGAAARLAEHLGEDLGRLSGIVETRLAAYGEGAKVTREMVEPFLGQAGAVPPWELTDAIDSGSPSDSLGALARMTGPGGRSAPEILTILHRHFAKMLRLDGADATSGAEAAALLGERSDFVAKKALAQGQRLGSERVAQAVLLLADADLDVKGRSGLPPEVVLEILVARLSRVARSRVSVAPR